MNRREWELEELHAKYDKLKQAFEELLADNIRDRSFIYGNDTEFEAKWRNKAGLTD